MGSNDAFGPDEHPVHEVELSGYFLGKYEVTSAQFEAFVSQTKHRTTAETVGSGDVVLSKDVAGVSWRRPHDPDKPYEDPRHPVVQVSWTDAKAYCAWAGVRLPTEAEWERAAAWSPRQGRARRYSWGDSSPEQTTGRVANLADDTFMKAFEDPLLSSTFSGYRDGFAFTAPVGSFPDGVSPAGALDMTGNVYEWCEDGYDPSFYSRSPRKDPVGGANAEERVFRGGSFDAMKSYCTASARGHNKPDYRRSSLGFRVAR
jgi:formylglycine-generating enzyme required for sulfatase activity